MGMSQSHVLPSGCTLIAVSAFLTLPAASLFH